MAEPLCTKNFADPSQRSNFSAEKVDQELKQRGLRGNGARNYDQFHPVRNEGTSNIVGLLMVCAKLKDLHKGSEVHAYIREHDVYVKNCYIGSSLINMYARCGALAKAQEVLEELPFRDVVTWNALIAGYSQQGKGKEALKCFDNMQGEGHFPTVVTFICLLKACGSMGAVVKGKEIHGNIVSLGLLEEHITLATTLVDMYARCGALAEAQKVFDGLSVQNVVSWTALLVGYTRQGLGQEALKCFDSMQLQGHSLDVVTFICALKACGSIGAAMKGEQIHDKVINLGLLEKNVVLGSTLVDMYARCGALAKAQQVLDELLVRNVVSWNALISGYVQQGQGEEALKCFEIMQLEGHSPNVVTFICALKACGSIGAANRGGEIHDRIASLGILGKDIELGNTLVDMYVKCGAFFKAQKVLEELPARDVVTWNALVAGYVAQGQGKEALNCFDKMQCQGYSPDVVTFICALRACGSIGAVVRGEEIHDKVASLGLLGKDIVLGSVLVDMYARFGALEKMQQVFEELPVRNEIMWNALIAGYTQWGKDEEALNCFDRMQHEGYLVDVVTISCALQACGSIGAAAKGQQIHDKILELGLLKKYSVLGNVLVDMYARCGLLAKAHQVFEELPVRDVGSWNALIGGHARQEEAEESLECFGSMQHEGHLPDAVTFTHVLKACGTIGAAAKGEEIHDKILSLGLLDEDDEDIMLGSTLVDMYAKCGALAKAQKVLEELPFRNVVSWNALIAGYARQGHSKEALKCFDSMQLEGHAPDAATFISALKACGSTGSDTRGKQIHDKVVRLGLLERDGVLGNTVVDMYARCGALVKAQQVLEELPVRDVVTWNVLIAGYVQHGQGEEALKCFDSMHCEGHSPDAVTFIYALQACGIVGAVAKGEEIHDTIVSSGLLDKDIALGSTLVDMYARCGALANAQRVFKKLPVQDVVTWNALIAGYVQHGQDDNALECFESMQHKCYSPDAVTFICALKACGSIGAAFKGEKIHEEIVGLGLLKRDIVLGNTLVDMYAKCAALTKAVEVLQELSTCNVVTWNAIIGGYAQKGQILEALNCFERMQEEGLRPDSATFVCLLNACSHVGLLEQAKMHLVIMNARYGAIPDVQHNCCLVDLFGRAGKLGEALELIREMPSSDYLPSWLVLLGACFKWGEMRIGRLAFECAIHLGKIDAAAYVCMANIYTGADMQEAHKSELMSMANGAWRIDAWI